MNTFHLLPARSTQHDARGCRNGKASFDRSSLWPT